MKMLYLGVDQGSHASRALLFDEQGNEVASAYEKVDLNRLQGGRVEQDAFQLITSINNVIDKVLRTYDSSQVVACGIATQRSSVLSWSKDGVANGAVLSWQDVRGGKLVEALQPHKVEIQKISGLPLSAHYGASKLRWLLDDDSNESGSLEPAYLSPLVSFFLYHLIETKPYLVDHSNAQRTQLMDVNTLDWSSRLANLFGVAESALPTCRPMCTDYGVLAKENIPVAAVCGDQNAAMFGVGKMSESTALVNLGSGAFILRTMRNNIPSKNQLSGIAYSDDKTVHYVREATINGAGSALSWLEKKYNVQQIKQSLNGWIETVKHPPLFLNAVGGLGSPWWEQDVDPVFIGADFNDKGALAVAVMESIIFMVRANLDLMVAESPLAKLRVSGGLSRSDGLCQTLSNLCAMPVERVDNPEATAKGVAWLAAGRPDGWLETDSVEQFKPDTNDALSQRYSQFIAALNNRLEMR